MIDCRLARIVSVPGIVDSELENKNIDRAIEMRRETMQPVFGGATAGAGIDHPKMGTDRTELIEQQHRPRFARTNPKTSR